MKKFLLNKTPISVNDLEKTSTDAWMACDRGVVKMDLIDYSMTHFTPANSNIPTEHIQSVVISSGGNPVIGTYDIVMLVEQGGEWDEIEIPSAMLGSGARWLHDLQIGPNGNYYLCTNYGLLEYNESNNVWSKLYEDQTVYGLIFDLEEKPVIMTNSEFLKLNESNNEWEIAYNSELWFNYAKINSFTDHEDNLWIYNNSSIGIFDGTDWVEFHNCWDADFPSSTLVTLFPENGEVIAVSEYGEYFKYENETWVETGESITIPTVGGIDFVKVYEDEKWAFVDIDFAREAPCFHLKMAY